MTAVAAPVSPYKGLAPFEDSELDALLFFGRERERDIIAANLTAYRLTVLYGSSGVGKSSVLRAGVAHQLRRRGDVVAVFSTWSGDPVAGVLAETYDALLQRFGAERVASREERLADSLTAWSQQLECDIYLILDQVDEYFLYHGEDDDFAEQFAEAARQESLRANFLISIREDMLAKLDRFKGQIPNLFSNYLRLDHLDRGAAKTAIEGPLERYNELVEPGERMSIEAELVEAVLDQTGEAGRIEAPYLQLVMERLWDEERAVGATTLRLATLERLGGAGDIVRAHLTDALDALAPAERDLAASLFTHLVTPSGTKIAHRLGDLVQYAGSTEGAVFPVVSTLVEERILRPVEEPGGDDGARYEIFHDVLAEPVSAWRDRHSGEQRVRDLERRRRRLLVVTAVSLVSLAAMALVTVFAFDQRGEAREQARRRQARELSATALSLMPVDPRRSLGLALRAAELDPTPEAESVLRRALLESRLRRIIPAGGAVRAASYSPDGTRVLTASGDGKARLADVRSGRLVQIFTTGSAVTIAEFGSDGSVLVAGGSSARVWREVAGSPGVTVRHRGHITAAHLSQDGTLLVTAGGEGAVRIWRTADGRPVAKVDHPGRVRDAVFSPDGRFLATIAANRLGRVQARVAAVPAGRLVHTFPEHGITKVAFDPDGARLAVARRGGSGVRVERTNRPDRARSPRRGRRRSGRRVQSRRKAHCDGRPRRRHTSLGRAHGFETVLARGAPQPGHCRRLQPRRKLPRDSKSRLDRSALEGARDSARPGARSARRPWRRSRRCLLQAGRPRGRHGQQ